MTPAIPAVLFVYCRPEHLRRTLESLRDNRVPLVYAFSDGPGAADKELPVSRVREMLRAVDWCEVVLREREDNLGLGRSVLAGVSEVLRTHEAAIIFEDDLVCVPGTYDYLGAALRHYRDDPRVMSVTGWTHPRITPGDVADQPYFDGRTDCWVWGTWARAWEGMQDDAKTLMKKCRAEGIDVYRYGADLPAMAERELANKIWAVRFHYWHLLNGGLCLRPPWSMVEHIGYDAEATNAQAGSSLKNPPLKPAPPIPVQWPGPVENPACSRLHQEAFGTRLRFPARLRRFARRVAANLWRAGLSQ
jgi:hypothetical protein